MYCNTVESERERAHASKRLRRYCRLRYDLAPLTQCESEATTRPAHGHPTTALRTFVNHMDLESKIKLPLL